METWIEYSISTIVIVCAIVDLIDAQVVRVNPNHMDGLTNKTIGKLLLPLPGSPRPVRYITAQMKQTPNYIL